MKVLFLYTELADYFIKCCEKLGHKTEVHIVRWPVNKEAPFEFKFPAGITVYEKNNFDRKQLVELAQKINPHLVVCSGWIDRDYLAVTRHFFRKVPTIMSCDTKWKGTLKQRLAIVLSRFTLMRIFSHAWVPGKKQEAYVVKLGFKPDRVLPGFYSCDLDRFNSLYKVKDPSTAKRFIYAGRYYGFKGVEDLWVAFTDLCNSGEAKDWELWCLGTGDLTPIAHPKIKHLGFVQPKDLAPILENTSVFILPSRVEPWGVVVQEFAAAGFPLLLSKEVGSAEAFLTEGENGFYFEANNSNNLKTVLKKVINLSPKELISMSQRSHALAQKISPEKWSQTLLGVKHEGEKK